MVVLASEISVNWKMRSIAETTSVLESSSVEHKEIPFYTTQIILSRQAYFALLHTSMNQVTRNVNYSASHTAAGSVR